MVTRALASLLPRTRVTHEKLYLSDSLSMPTLGMSSLSHRLKRSRKTRNGLPILRIGVIRAHTGQVNMASKPEQPAQLQLLRVREAIQEPTLLKLNPVELGLRHHSETDIRFPRGLVLHALDYWPL